MNDALAIMHAREVRPALDALRWLDVPKFWLCGFTEREISDGFDVFLHSVKLGGFDWLWFVSDDAIVRPHALDAVRYVADHHPENVVTGYSQRDHTDMTVNLTDRPLSGNLESPPTAESYSFLKLHQVMSHPRPSLPTWFTGMSLTGMSLTRWHEFPFNCFGTPGYASDFHLSLRLQKAKVPIIAARDAFCYHWRSHWIYHKDSVDEKVQLGRREVVFGPEPPSLRRAAA